MHHRPPDSPADLAGPYAFIILQHPLQTPRESAVPPVPNASTHSNGFQLPASRQQPICIAFPRACRLHLSGLHGNSPAQAQSLCDFLNSAMGINPDHARIILNSAIGLPFHGLTPIPDPPEAPISQPPAFMFYPATSIDDGPIRIAAANTTAPTSILAEHSFPDTIAHVVCDVLNRSLAFPPLAWARWPEMICS